MSEQVGYQFGPSAPRGVFLGQTSAQFTLLVLDGFVFLRIVDHGQSWTARFIEIALLALLVTWGYLPVRGQTLIDWTRVVLLYTLQRLTGHNDYVGGVFRVRREDIEVPAAKLPGLLGATRFVELDTGPGSPPIVVVNDQREGTYLGVLQLKSESFYVLEAADQQKRINAYGLMLGAPCKKGSVVKRTQILERTVPDTSDVLERDMNVRAADAVALTKVGVDAGDSVDVNGRHHNGTAPNGQVDAAAGVRFATGSYQELIEAAGPAGRRHEVYVALVIDGNKAARQIAKSGGGDIGAAAVVSREISILANGLQECGVQVLGWAPPRLLGYILRTAFDPAATDTIDRRGGGRGDVAGGTGGLPSGVDLRQAAPHRAVNMWDCYRTDSAYHRSFWVAEWPRREAPAAFLGPLLTYAEGRRSISLVYEPRDAQRATKMINRKKDKAEAESGMRARWRLRRSKRAEQNYTHMDRREDELLAGEQLNALRAYITISGSTREELDSVEADILSLAQSCQIELQPMTGTHDQGFAVGAVPLGRSI